jgi:hypothetical protein
MGREYSTSTVMDNRPSEAPATMRGVPLRDYVLGGDLGKLESLSPCRKHSPLRFSKEFVRDFSLYRSIGAPHGRGGEKNREER